MGLLCDILSQIKSWSFVTVTLHRCGGALFTIKGAVCLPLSPGQIVTQWVFALPAVCQPFDFQNVNGGGHTWHPWALNRRLLSSPSVYNDFTSLSVCTALLTQVMQLQKVSRTHGKVQICCSWDMWFFSQPSGMIKSYSGEDLMAGCEIC